MDQNITLFLKQISNVNKFWSSEVQAAIKFIVTKYPLTKPTFTKLEQFYRNNNLNSYQLTNIINKIQNLINTNIHLQNEFEIKSLPTSTIKQLPKTYAEVSTQTDQQSRIEDLIIENNTLKLRINELTKIINQFSL